MELGSGLKSWTFVQEEVGFIILFPAVVWVRRGLWDAQASKHADEDCDTPLGGSQRKASPFHSVTSSARRSFSRKRANEFYDSAYPDAAEQISSSEQPSSSDNSSSLQPASACDGREPSAAPPQADQDQELTEVMNGGAYLPAKYGPPRPPCNPERVATVRRIDLLDEPPDPKLGVSSCS